MKGLHQNNTTRASPNQNPTGACSLPKLAGAGGTLPASSDRGVAEVAPPGNGQQQQRGRDQQQSTFPSLLDPAAAKRSDALGGHYRGRWADRPRRGGRAHGLLIVVPTHRFMG